MIKRNYILTTLLLFPFFAGAQSVEYGPGLFHVNPAWTIKKHSLYLGGHSRAFFKDEIQKNRKNEEKHGTTYWDIQGGMGLYYGLSSKFQLGLSQIVYQDTHEGGAGYSAPGNLYLQAKLGNLSPPKSSWMAGLQLDLYMPISDYSNIPLEPYRADRIGIGLKALFSIVSEPLFPQYGFNIHGNLGIFSHNDLGLVLTDADEDTITVNETTQELIYGIAFSTSMQEFGLFAELYGRTFLTQPPISAYSRENSLYISPGISYTPNAWMKLKVALDLRILGGDDETLYKGEKGSFAQLPWEHVPNYPSWRINLGTVIALNRKKSIEERQKYLGVQKSRAFEAISGKETIYDHLTDERREAENVEAELERIRADRERMEKLLQRLKTILESPSQQEEK